MTTAPDNTPTESDIENYRVPKYQHILCGAPIRLETRNLTKRYRVIALPNDGGVSVYKRIVGVADGGRAVRQVAKECGADIIGFGVTTEEMVSLKPHDSSEDSYRDSARMSIFLEGDEPWVVDEGVVDRMLEMMGLGREAVKMRYPTDDYKHVFIKA